MGKVSTLENLPMGVGVGVIIPNYVVQEGQGASLMVYFVV